MLRRLALTSALALHLIASAAASAAEPTVIATESRPSKVAAFGQDVMWSHFDEASGSYALMRRTGEAEPVAVAVATRGAPFDVDLGPGPDGHLTAAYSRCADEAASLDTELPDTPSNPWVEWELQRRCRVFLLDLVTGQERPLDTGASASDSDYLPAIWKNRVAFVRKTKPRRGAEASPAQASIVALDTRSGRLRRVGGGPKGELVSGFDRYGPGPMSVDLRGRSVTYEWRYWASTKDKLCPGQPVGPLRQRLHQRDARLGRVPPAAAPARV